MLRTLGTGGAHALNMLSHLSNATPREFGESPRNGVARNSYSCIIDPITAVLLGMYLQENSIHDELLHYIKCTRGKNSIFCEMFDKVFTRTEICSTNVRVARIISVWLTGNWKIL